MNEDENKTINIDDEEDNVVEFVFNDDGEEDLKATIKKLRKDVKEAKKEKEEYLNSWQRERADFANFKREEGDRLSRAEARGAEKLIEAILPALDSFDMAMANKETWEKVDANWRMGVEYIRSQMKTALEDSNVQEINPAIGSAFDPMSHESIGTEETDDSAKDHTIATVVQKGYKIGDPSNSSGQARVLRPARVKLFESK